MEYEVVKNRVDIHSLWEREKEREFESQPNSN